MGKQLHLISTARQTVDELIRKIANIHPCIDFLHLREPDWSIQTHLAAIRALGQVGFGPEKIIMSDRVDLAYLQSVYGVQLPHHSFPVTMIRRHFPKLKIGRSVQTVQDAIEAERAGADWLIHGHIFPTASKEGLKPRGLDSLSRITEQVSIPVIAIGGITPGRCQAVLEAGASGIAVLSGILLAQDPEKAAAAYAKALGKE